MYVLTATAIYTESPIYEFPADFCLIIFIAKGIMSQFFLTMCKGADLIEITIVV